MYQTLYGGIIGILVAFGAWSWRLNSAFFFQFSVMEVFTIVTA